MWWCLLACAPTPTVGSGAPMDQAPDRVVTAGRWTATVARGLLTVRGEGEARTFGPGVLPGVAIHDDLLVFARGDAGDADLLLVRLPAGEPVRLTDWEGYEDRPSFSPDGGRVAFFSGRAGLPALYVLDLATGTSTQLTNAGVDPAAHRPGEPPAGFVPPPDTGAAAWDGATLTWTARGEPVSVGVP